MEYKYQHSILGGTFDHLHAGHKYFINQALRNSQNLTIGLTENGFSKGKPFSFSIEDFGIRKTNLKSYLDRIKCLNRVKIIPIDNIYGTTLSNKNIDAIYVTSHGFRNAKMINKKRSELNFQPLIISVVVFLRGEDGRVISSSRIRSGEIDRRGRSYLRVFKQDLSLQDSLRGEVKHIPRGTIIKTDADYKKAIKNKFVIAVGDIVASNLVRLESQSDVSIVDFKSEKAPIQNSILRPTFEARNDAGTINQDAVRVLKSAIDKSIAGNSKEVVKVIGEEDLLSLPATLLAPLDSTVLYGMPNVGAVVVSVTEEAKSEVKKIVEKFVQL